MNDNDLRGRYTPSEEVANAMSHLIGLIMSLIVCAWFLSEAFHSADVVSIVSMSVYLFGVVSSYFASTLYHACPSRKERMKQNLRKFDHAAIYWHIAGSYTPITMIAMYGFGATGWAVSVTAFVWLCAVAGTFATFRKMKSHSYFKTLCYVMMGLFILVAIKPFYDSVGAKIVMLVIFEGISYIVGAILYSFKKIRYIHSVFHVFVLFGDLFHMLAVWKVLQMYLLVS